MEWRIFRDPLTPHVQLFGVFFTAWKRFIRSAELPKNLFAVKGKWPLIGSWGRWTSLLCAEVRPRGDEWTCITIEWVTPNSSLDQTTRAKTDCGAFGILCVWEIVSWRWEGNQSFCISLWTGPQLFSRLASSGDFEVQNPHYADHSQAWSSLKIISTAWVSCPASRYELGHLLTIPYGLAIVVMYLTGHHSEVELSDMRSVNEPGMRDKPSQAPIQL
jgi:hypothetical protein